MPPPPGQVTIEFGEELIYDDNDGPVHETAFGDDTIYDDGSGQSQGGRSGTMGSIRDIQERPLPKPKPAKPDGMTQEQWVASEAKRKKGTVRVSIRKSDDLYIRYDKDNVPDRKKITETVVKEGMMYKRAVGKSKVGRTNWKDRFFRLTTMGLSYWDGDPRLHASAKKKGQLAVASIRSVDEIHTGVTPGAGVPADVVGKKFVLAITYDVWTLYIQAPSAADLFDWMSLLTTHSTRARSENRSKVYTEQWFCGSINKAAAQEILLDVGAATGDYMVTQSAKSPSDFVLIVRNGPTNIKSFPVVEREGMFAIRSSRASKDAEIGKVCAARCRTLPDLINALKRGGKYGKAMAALSGCELLRPVPRNTALPIFARVQSTTESLAHRLNTGGNISDLSAFGNRTPQRAMSMVATKGRAGRGRKGGSVKNARPPAAGSSSWMGGLPAVRSGSIGSATSSKSSTPSFNDNEEYGVMGPVLPSRHPQVHIPAEDPEALYENTKPVHEYPTMPAQIHIPAEDPEALYENSDVDYLQSVERVQTRGEPAYDFAAQPPSLALSGFGSEDSGGDALYSDIGDGSGLPSSAAAAAAQGVKWEEEFDGEEFDGFDNVSDSGTAGAPPIPPKTAAVVYDPDGYGFNDDSDDDYEQME